MVFHKEDVETYKSISAPAELKTKVMMAESKGKIFPYQQLYLVAACLAMIISLSAVWNWNHSVISLQGSGQNVSLISNDEKKATAFASNAARDGAKTSISIEISSSHKRKIIVSEGSLLYVNADNEEMMNSGSKMWVEPDSEVLWQLDGQIGKQYQLKVTGWGKDKVYLLNYNQENDNWEMKEQ